MEKFERLENLVKRDATIVFKNFSGEERKPYNPSGRRNFCLLLTEDEAEKLYDEGWNVKRFKQRDPDEVPDAYIQVAVNYGNYPPAIYMVTGRKKVLLDEDTIGGLDYAEIEKIDVEVRPSRWKRDDGTFGVKAYVKTMYVTISEDVFANDYPDFEADLVTEEEEIPF